MQLNRHIADKSGTYRTTEHAMTHFGFNDSRFSEKVENMVAGCVPQKSLFTERRIYISPFSVASTHRPTPQS